MLGWICRHSVNKYVDGTTLAAVKRLTGEKLLRADMRMMPHCKDDSTPAELRQVILFDKQMNINSVIAGHRVTFIDAASELLYLYVSLVIMLGIHLRQPRAVPFVSADQW